MPDELRTRNGRKDECLKLNPRVAHVLVVGGGPAGIAAATRAAERGLKTILVDDNLQLGGQIWRAPAGRPLELSHQATVWIGKLRASKATIHLESRVVARVSEHRVLVESKAGAEEISYRDLIIATGARERFLPFPGWTLPNVTGAGGLQALVKGGLPVSGKKIVVAGTGPLLLAVAAFLRKKGAVVEGVYEQASRRKILRFLLRLASAPGKGLQALQSRVEFSRRGVQRRLVAGCRGGIREVGTGCAHQRASAQRSRLRFSRVRFRAGSQP